MNILEELFKSWKLIVNNQPIRGETIDNDIFHNGDANIVVDTCFVNDLKAYETAIQVGSGEIVVVERYRNANDAKIGHKLWVDKCKQKSFYFYSVQTGEMYVYKP